MLVQREGCHSSAVDSSCHDSRGGRDNVLCLLASPEHTVKRHLCSCRGVGATAVLLTPVVMTAEGDGPMGQAPMSFFAPNPSLGVGPGPLAASQDLKHVIKQLHLHGIEVILQVRTANRPKMSSKQCISSTFPLELYSKSSAEAKRGDRASNLNTTLEPCCLPSHCLRHGGKGCHHRI